MSEVLSETPAGDSLRFAVKPTVSDHFSWIRTRLSVERTMMSWVRTAVALIGFGFSRGPDRAMRMVAITIVVNTVIRYMSVFALQHVFDIQIIHLINALITVVFLLGVIVTFRSAELNPPGGSN